MSVQDYSEQSNRRYFKLNAKTGELLESVKEGDVYTKIKRKSVSGNFVRLEIKEKEYEGKKSEELNILLDDLDEQYVVQTSWSSLGRSLVNALAGEVSKRKLGKLSISLWNTTTKMGKDVCYLMLNNYDNKAEWKYGIEEQKAMIEIVRNKKDEYVSTDYSEYEKALKSHIEEINDNNPEKEITHENDEDLPF